MCVCFSQYLSAYLHVRIILQKHLWEDCKWHASPSTGLQGLVAMADKYPISDVRGRGLMVALEFGGADGSLVAKSGVAAAVTKAAGKRNMLLLSAGALCKPYAQKIHLSISTFLLHSLDIQLHRIVYGDCDLSRLRCACLDAYHL